MNILFDFGSIKSGGGAQLATNFVDRLDELKQSPHKVFMVTPTIGPLAGRPTPQSCVSSIPSPASYVRRWYFEYRQLAHFIKKNDIEAIYTFFGAGLPHPRHVRSVVNVAYPIICYPDSPYWKYIAYGQYLRIKTLIAMRVIRLRNATTIIVETETMRRRVARVLERSAEKIRVIPPSVSSYVHDNEWRQNRPVKNFVFVSGLDGHKNLWRLYEVALELRRRKWMEFTFTLTATRELYLNTLRAAQCDTNVIDLHFRFLGTVPPTMIMDVYRDADVVVSLSDLESFSNNYMEAWRVGLPIIASERDFAREICGGSAIYVEPHDADDVCNKMMAIASDGSLRKELVEVGKSKLKALPSQQERFGMVMDVILNA